MNNFKSIVEKLVLDILNPTQTLSNIKNKINDSISNFNELNIFLNEILQQIDNLDIDSLKKLTLHKTLLLDILKNNKYINYKTIVIISNSKILLNLKQIFIKKFLNAKNDLSTLFDTKTIKIFIDYIKKNNIKLLNTNEESKEYLDLILNLNDNNSNLLELLFSYFTENLTYYHNSIIIDIINSNITNNLKIKLCFKLLNAISENRTSVMNILDSNKLFLQMKDYITKDNEEYFMGHILNSAKTINMYLFYDIISSNEFNKEIKLYYLNQIIEFDNKTDISNLNAYQLYEKICFSYDPSRDFVEDEIFKEAVFFSLMKSKKLTSLHEETLISQNQNLINNELKLKLCKKTFENAKENNIDLFEISDKGYIEKINIIDVITLYEDGSNFNFFYKKKTYYTQDPIKEIFKSVQEYIKDYVNSYLVNQSKEKQQEYLKRFKEYENSKYYNYILKFFYDEESDSYTAFNKCDISMYEPLQDENTESQNQNTYPGNITQPTEQENQDTYPENTIQAIGEENEEISLEGNLENNIDSIL